ncbi:MAG: ABC-2 family transporter protein [Defluviitaleaceae bacterium]|nr:ABC-2 family transporter protein [Defluviitaleaceae bacterium]
MKLYMKYFSIHLKSQTQYKTSFLFTMLGQFMVSFAVFMSLAFLFMLFDSVDGFTYQEVLIGFAVMMLGFSLAEMFGRGFDRFPVLLGNGGFDRALVRPRNIIFQIVAGTIEFSRLGRALQAVIVFVYVIPRAGIDWTWDKVLTLVLMIVCGIVLFFTLFVLYAAFSFFTIEGLEFMHIFTDGGREHGRLPFSVYGENVLRFVTFVIPLALVQYYPLLYLLGREESILYALAPVGALLFLLPVSAFFRFGLKRYKSTGS